MSDNGFNVSVDDVYTDYVDKPDASDEAGEYPGGNTGIESALLAHPDQAEYAKLLDVVRTAIRSEIDRERKYRDALDNTAVRVTSNLSGQVLFARYTVNANRVVQIVREKPLRGNLTIVNFTDTVPVYVGLHVGILPGGTDTAMIVGTATGTGRVIRTRRALWATASADVNIDVQEEFD
jgi:hypothetical protein